MAAGLPSEDVGGSDPLVDYLSTAGCIAVLTTAAAWDAESGWFRRVDAALAFAIQLKIVRHGTIFRRRRRPFFRRTARLR